MKKILQFSPRFLPIAGAALGLALLFAFHLPAQDATNASLNSATNETPVLEAARQTAGEKNYFGLPKEAFDRLTPDQIMELAQSHPQRHETGAESVADQIAAIAVSLGMFTMICVSVALGVTQRLKRTRMQHETLRLMIEKGQPIPPELLQPQEPLRRPRSDLRTGLILIGVGLGLVIIFGSIHQPGIPKGAMAFGAIPLLMGVAFLITWKIESKKNGQPK